MNCHNCNAKLTYPVFYNGLPYGADCAEKLFGLHIPPGMSDITSFVSNHIANQDRLNEELKKGLELFKTHYAELCKYRDLMKSLRVSNQWEYEFLLNMMSVIGAINWTDTTEDEGYYLYEFNLSNMSEKQFKLFKKITN